MGVGANKRRFSDAVCEHFRCAPGAYAETVFWHCLYPHAVLPARLIRWFIPDYFDSDFELIRLVANSTESVQLRAEVRLHQMEPPPGILLRRLLRLRLSGQRLINLGGHVFAQPTAEIHHEPKPSAG